MLDRANRWLNEQIVVPRWVLLEVAVWLLVATACVFVVIVSL